METVVEQALFMQALAFSLGSAFNGNALEMRGLLMMRIAGPFENVLDV